MAVLSYCAWLFLGWRIVNNATRVTASNLAGEDLVTKARLYLTVYKEIQDHLKSCYVLQGVSKFGKKRSGLRLWIMFVIISTTTPIHSLHLYYNPHWPDFYAKVLNSNFQEFKFWKSASSLRQYTCVWKFWLMLEKKKNSSGWDMS